jgi:NADPH-ferrihemoprotein reductase
VYPENEAVLVNQLAHRLNADLDGVVALVPINQKGDDTTESVLGPCTVRQALTDSIDITTPPRKAVLRALADYATDVKDKQRLLLLASEAGAEEYNKFIKGDQRTISEVLQAFPSVNPPLGHVLELLPRLAPRYYSISSSPNFHPGFVHITSVVVNFTTSVGRSHNGVCSSWMSTLPVGAHVPVFVRESHFRIPPAPAPLIMIGPGTGLAPFRGFLQELSHRKSQGEGWESALFFGCRDRKHDFIYEDELLHYTQNGTLSHLQLAFSW